jgi:integrase/recombinase XerD
MLEQFFDSPRRLQSLRTGPSGTLLERFARVLCQSGYSKETARTRIRAAEHFIYWADKRGIAAASFNEQLIARFDRHLIRCRCRGYGRRRLDSLRGARSLVSYVLGAGIDIAYATELAPEDPVLLMQFREWMREQRGTGDGTLYNYSIRLRDLLKRIGADVARLSARTLREFVLEQSHNCGWGAAKVSASAVRMFVRFLIAEGQCAAGLCAAIPLIAHWRLSSLPRYLQAEEVERIIASCNPSSPVGKRNRAILLLLARLGLRASDIVRLRLDDIDWKASWIRVSGKGKRQTKLPLTQELGQAIVDYLQDAPPQSSSDRVFVRSRAPFRAFAHHTAVSHIVRRAMRRAGVTCLTRGAAHLLRHSAATSMLRHGASMQDIAAILRHRSIDTTQIYTKVDVTLLQSIAQPWPEAQSC